MLNASRDRLQPSPKCQPERFPGEPVPTPLTSTGFISIPLDHERLKELHRIKAVDPKELTHLDIFWLISLAKTKDILRIIVGTLESNKTGELQKQFCWDLLNYVYNHKERSVSMVNYANLLFTVGHLDTLSPTNPRSFSIKNGGSTPDFIYRLINKSDTVEELVGVLLALFFTPLDH